MYALIYILLGLLVFTGIVFPIAVIRAFIYENWPPALGKDPETVTAMYNFEPEPAQVPLFNFWPQEKQTPMYNFWMGPRLPGASKTWGLLCHKNGRRTFFHVFA